MNITNCTFENNSALGIQSFGGVLTSYALLENIIIINSKFKINSASYTGVFNFYRVNNITFVSTSFI